MLLLLCHKISKSLDIYINYEEDIANFISLYLIEFK